MKKAIILCTVLGLLSFGLQAQKFAFVDSESVLNQIPAYQEALTEIDKLASQWQADISKEYDSIDRLYKNFQAESVLLSESMRVKREEEIVEREKQVKQLQKQKFGVDGELFKKREELIAPIQQKIFDAIEALAKQKAYDFIFDSSSNSNILFAGEEFNKSDEILKAILK